MHEKDCMTTREEQALKKRMKSYSKKRLEIIRMGLKSKKRTQ